MKTVYIISSIKNLNYEYEHLRWLRLFFLNYDYRISEDWINHSLNIRNNRPHFKAAPNFDYMKVATQAVNESDALVFLLSKPSTFTLTILRYALYLEKEVIVISSGPSVMQGLEKGKESLITSLRFSDYQKRMKELYE